MRQGQTLQEALDCISTSTADEKSRQKGRWKVDHESTVRLAGYTVLTGLCVSTDPQLIHWWWATSPGLTLEESSLP